MLRGPMANAKQEQGARRPLSILVADDEHDTVLTLSALLTDEGHVVHSVTHGALVLDAVRRFRPQVCILDIEMPGQNGYGLARDIVEEHKTARPLLIAISGRWKTQTDKLLAKTVGFDHFITKPADPLEVIETVARAASDAA
jgi:CheY-like chemotaxis protein